MCGAVLASGACDPSQENLFPSPDASAATIRWRSSRMHSPRWESRSILKLAMRCPRAPAPITHPAIRRSYASSPASREWSTGRTAWRSPRFGHADFASCAAGGDCSTRFPYGQKDSYHYVLFGHSLAIPAWNTPYQTLTSINTNSVASWLDDHRHHRTGAPQAVSTIAREPLHHLRRAGKHESQRWHIQHFIMSRRADTIILSTPSIPNWSVSQQHVARTGNRL